MNLERGGSNTVRILGGRVLLGAVALALAALGSRCGGGNSSSGGGGTNIVSVTISPATVTLSGGATQQFTATVIGTSDTVVTWTATAGTISTSGLYTAPNPASGTATVTATSQADAAASSSASVTFSSSSAKCSFPAATSVTVSAGQTTKGVNVAVGTLTPTLAITAVGLNNSASAATISLTPSSNASLLIVGSGLTAAEQQSCLLFGVSGPGDVQVTQPAAGDFFMCGVKGGPLNMPCAQVSITVSANATPGGRDILVTNGKEVATFVGGLLITGGP